MRQDIIEAATHVFSRLGYHGSSMQDIAVAAGMRKASLYHHLRKKEDLLFAIHENLVDKLLVRTTEALALNQTPTDKLTAVLHTTMDFISTNREAVTVFLQESRAVTGERWDVLVAKRDQVEDLVIDVIRGGVESGDFEDLPPKIVARGVLGMANWCYTWFNPDGAMTAAEVADVFAELVTKGLQRRPASA